MPQASVLQSVIQPKPPSSGTVVRAIAPDLPARSTDEIWGNDPDDLGIVLGVLVENAPVAMAMFDREMRYLLANRQWITDFGLQESLPLVGRSQFEIFPNLHPGWRGVYDRALDGHVVRSEHDVMQDPTGKPVIFRWEVRPWRRRQDAGVAGAMITCEKFAPITVPASEDATVPENAVPATPPRSVTIALPECELPVLTVDLDGVIQEANAAASHLVLSRGLQVGHTTFWGAFGAQEAQNESRSATIQAIAQVVACDGKMPVSLRSPVPEGDSQTELLWAVTTAAAVAEEPRALMVGVIHPKLVPLAVAPTPPAGIPHAQVQAIQAAHQLEVRRLNDQMQALRNELGLQQDLEGAYKRREVRQRDVLDAIPCGLVVIDARGLPSFHNTHVRHLFGRELKPGDTVEDWLTDACLNETHKAEVAGIWRESVWRRQLTKIVSLSTADGLLKDFELRPSPLPDNGMLITIHDVTEHCRLEEMLRATEAKFRTVLHDAPFAAVLTDASGAIFEVNRAAEQLLGHPKSELRRSSMEDFLVGDSTRAYRVELGRLANGSQTSATCEVDVRRAGTNDGSQAKLKVAAILDGDGRLHAAAHFLTPVGKTLIAAEAQHLVSAVTPPRCEDWQPLMKANCHGRVIAWSDDATKLLGWTEAEAMQRSLHSFFRPSDAGAFFADLDQALAKPDAAFELPFFAKDGSHGMHVFRLRRFEGDGCTEILVATEAEAPASAAALASDVGRERALLTETHHRITNHLQLISSLLNLQTASLDTADARQALRSSQNRVRAIAALHQHLFRFATEGRTSFAAFVTELVERLRECYEVPATRVAVSFALDGLRPRDESLVPLALVLNEAISNAFQHAFPNGRSGEVIIRFGSDNSSTASLTIQDDGIGLPQAFATAPGGGLGMKVVHLFAEQLRGSASLESIIPNGLIFGLHFPITCVDI